MEIKSSGKLTALESLSCRLQKSTHRDHAMRRDEGLRAKHLKASSLQCIDQLRY